jgi:hypothetical protein
MTGSRRVGKSTRARPHPNCRGCASRPDTPVKSVRGAAGPASSLPAWVGRRRPRPSFLRASSFPSDSSRDDERYCTGTATDAEPCTLPRAGNRNAHCETCAPLSLGQPTVASVSRSCHRNVAAEHPLAPALLSQSSKGETFGGPRGKQDEPHPRTWRRSLRWLRL